MCKTGTQLIVVKEDKIDQTIKPGIAGFGLK